jgi:hypothetical protein
MKFAKLLRVTATELPEVEEVLRCYKTSKKVLKSWPDADSTDEGAASSRDHEFVHTLSVHLSQFIETWTARLQAFHIRCSAMEEQVCISARPCEL